MNTFQNKNSRIINYSLYNMDGAVASIMLKSYFNNISVNPIANGDDEKVYKEIKNLASVYDGVIFCDYCPNNIEKIAEDFPNLSVLVIDHHDTATLHNEKYVWHSKDECASQMVYKCWSRFTDLTKYNDLVYYTADYDLWKHEKPTSLCYNAIYWHMGFNVFVNRFANGSVRFNDNELEYLKNYFKGFKEYWDNVEAVVLPNNGLLINSTKYMAETSLKIEADFDWYILNNEKRIYVRTRRKDIDLSQIAVKLGFGSGNARAITIPINTYEEGNAIIGRIIKKMEKV